MLTVAVHASFPFTMQPFLGSCGPTPCVCSSVRVILLEVGSFASTMLSALVTGLIGRHVQYYQALASLMSFAANTPYHSFYQFPTKPL